MKAAFGLRLAPEAFFVAFLVATFLVAFLVAFLVPAAFFVAFFLAICVSPSKITFGFWLLFVALHE